MQKSRDRNYFSNIHVMKGKYKYKGLNRKVYRAERLRRDARFKYVLTGDGYVIDTDECYPRFPEQDFIMDFAKTLKSNVHPNMDKFAAMLVRMNNRE